MDFLDYEFTDHLLQTTVVLSVYIHLTAVEEDLKLVCSLPVSLDNR